MSEVLIEVGKQVPSLVILVLIVLAFLKHLDKRDEREERAETMLASALGSLEKAINVLREEVLRASAGRGSWDRDQEGR